MNKYAILKVSNGAFFIMAESDDVEKAIVAFHDACKNLWNAPDVKQATVAIVDADLNYVGGYVERIKHDQAAE